MSFLDGALTPGDIDPAPSKPANPAKSFNPFTFNLAARSSNNCPFSPAHTDREVRSYFSDVEELSTHLGLTDRDTISMAIYYAHDEQRALFKSLKSADEDSWKTFKSNVLGYLYPDAYFNMDDLKKYVQEFWAKRKRVQTAQDLRKFYGGFLLILNDVQEKNKQKFNRKEMGEMFLNALPLSLSTVVLGALKAEAGEAELVITPHRVFGKAVKLVGYTPKESLAKLY